MASPTLMVLGKSTLWIRVNKQSRKGHAMTDTAVNLQNLLTFLNASIELQPGQAQELRSQDSSDSCTPSNRAVHEQNSAVQAMQERNEL